MSDIPSDLRYTAEHEWVRRSGDDTVRVGITDFAQSALGDVVFVQLPDVGSEVTAGESFGEVESTKSVSDLFAPVSGTVSAVNGDLEGGPQLVELRPVRGRLAGGCPGFGRRRARVGHLDAARRRGLPRNADRMTIANVPASPARRCGRRTRSKVGDAIPNYASWEPGNRSSDPPVVGALRTGARYGRHITSRKTLERH